jgi:hypothetical protein
LVNDHARKTVAAVTAAIAVVSTLDDQLQRVLIAAAEDQL